VFVVKRGTVAVFTAPLAVGAMYERLGVGGIVGLLLVVGGIALVAWQAPVVAAGLAFVLAGVGLVVRALVGNVMKQFGLF
jgi:drug/metabolite transporter (DMT)-like permease